MATYIPINDIRPYNSYVASANQTTFVFDWFVQKEEYVTVYKNEQLLANIQDYSFAVNSIGNATGGSISLAVGCTAGDLIVIVRNSSIKRVTGFSESGEFRASAVNLELNYLVTLIQELNFRLGRCIILSETDADTASSGLVLPKRQDRLGKYMGFDNNGNLIAVGGSSIDLYYNWVRVSNSITLDKSPKKIYAQIAAEITIRLPIVSGTDDGREIFILNLDSNEHDVIIDPNSETLTIDGEDQIILTPGEYKKFIYNHALSKWFSID